MYKSTIKKGFFPLDVAAGESLLIQPKIMTSFPDRLEFKHPHPRKIQRGLLGDHYQFAEITGPQRIVVASPEDQTGSFVLLHLPRHEEFCISPQYVVGFSPNGNYRRRFRSNLLFAPQIFPTVFENCSTLLLHIPGQAIIQKLDNDSCLYKNSFLFGWSSTLQARKEALQMSSKQCVCHTDTIMQTRLQGTGLVLLGSSQKKREFHLLQKLQDTGNLIKNQIL